MDLMELSAFSYVDSLQRVALLVFETACRNHNQIDKPPNPETAEGNQFQNSCSDFAYIEPVNTQ